MIDEGWPAASGSGAIARFERFFSVSSALRDRPDTKFWHVAPPRAGTRASLTVDFDRPFDRELALIGLAVLDGAGRPVEGDVSLAENERQWQFVPHRPWSGGTFQLSVDARLEDVAGNNFRELLDHELGSVPGNFDRLIIPFATLPAPG